MNTLSKIISSTRIARLKLLLGSALLFASMTAAGQAQSLYPQEIQPGQTGNVVHSDVRPAVEVRSLYPQKVQAAKSASVARRCTQLEMSAEMIPSECGTLTLSDVVILLNALETDGRDG
ncbi:hypothetical protein, partial [Ovoidimarina sediminis]|uniref:hypothetical protein n=1 Tax=Ovoidimarina sediminis TaxID=3079856 RepID=UPI0029064CFC